MYFIFKAVLSFTDCSANRTYLISAVQSRLFVVDGEEEHVSQLQIWNKEPQGIPGSTRPQRRRCLVELLLIFFVITGYRYLSFSLPTRTAFVAHLISPPAPWTGLLCPTALSHLHTFNTLRRGTYSPRHAPKLLWFCFINFVTQTIRSPWLHGALTNTVDDDSISPRCVGMSNIPQNVADIRGGWVCRAYTAVILFLLFVFLLFFTVYKLQAKWLIATGVPPGHSAWLTKNQK